MYRMDMYVGEISTGGERLSFTIDVRVYVIFFLELPRLKRNETRGGDLHLRVLYMHLYALSICIYRGRRGGLMVIALDSGSSGPGSSPSRGTALCSWARHYSHSASLDPDV